MAENIANDQGETSNEVKTMIDTATLHKMAREYGGMKGKMDETRGEMGAWFKNAENDHGLNKAAFKLAIKLKDTDDLKREAFLIDLDHYLDAFGLRNQTSLIQNPPAKLAAA